MTLLTALRTACTGFGDSLAASVTISLPMKEKTTSSMPERIAPGPCGRNPPCPVRFSVPTGEPPGGSPNIASAPITMKTTIATTLIPANQNSNSPNEPTETRFVPVSTIITSNAQAH